VRLVLLVLQLWDFVLGEYGEDGKNRFFQFSPSVWEIIARKRARRRRRMHVGVVMYIVEGEKKK